MSTNFGIKPPSSGLYVDMTTGAVQTGHTQFRNRIINGDMRIAQRGTSSTANGKTYIIDRFATWTSITTGQLTTTQNTLTTSDLPYQYGFKYSNKITVTVAVSSYLWIAPVQVIEGINISDLNWGTIYGSSVTVSFWFRSNANGTHSFAIRNGAGGTTNYHTIFNVSSINWQYLTFVIPPPPSETTWVTDSTNGLEVFICPLFTATKSIGWSTVNQYLGVTGSINWPATLNNYIEFTGVQLEKGTQATPFEFRPLQVETQLCYRYYQEFGPYQMTAQWWSATGVYLTACAYIPFRANATPGQIAGTTIVFSATNNNNYSSTNTIGGYQTISNIGFSVYLAGFNGGTLGTTGYLVGGSTARYYASAEL